MEAVGQAFAGALNEALSKPYTGWYTVGGEIRIPAFPTIDTKALGAMSAGDFALRYMEFWAEGRAPQLYALLPRATRDSISYSSFFGSMFHCWPNNTGPLVKPDRFEVTRVEPVADDVVWVWYRATFELLWPRLLAPESEELAEYHEGLPWPMPFGPWLPSVIPVSADQSEPLDIQMGQVMLRLGAPVVLTKEEGVWRVDGLVSAVGRQQGEAVDAKFELKYTGERDEVDGAKAISLPPKVKPSSD